MAYLDKLQANGVTYNVVGEGQGNQNLFFNPFFLTFNDDDETYYEIEDDNVDMFYNWHLKGTGNFHTEDGAMLMKNTSSSNDLLCYTSFATEVNTLIRDKKVTFSIGLLSDAVEEGYNSSFSLIVIDKDDDIVQSHDFTYTPGVISTYTFTMPRGISKIGIKIAPNAYIGFNSVKLELGGISTLINELPDYYSTWAQSKLIEPDIIVGEGQSNPNLLDNGWFTVNQRKSSFDSGNYGCDRWKDLNDSGAMYGEVVDSPGPMYPKKPYRTFNYIQFQNPSEDKYIGQLIEISRFSNIKGKNITLSVLAGSSPGINYVLYSATGVFDGVTELLCEAGNGHAKLVFIDHNTMRLNLCGYANKTQFFYAVKLEVGEASTLANDPMPDYSEELFRCSTSTADASDTFANNLVNLCNSNQNLLDNPWFTVNQRGKSVYGENGYGYDRWKMESAISYGTVRPADDGLGGIKIMHDADSGFIHVFQTLENAIPSNQIVTLSVKFTDGTIKTRTGTMSSMVWGGSGSFYQEGWDIYTGGNTDVFLIRIGSGITKQIRAVKLELGSVSTLANDSAPNYAEELIRCISSSADGSDDWANKGESPVLTTDGRAVTSPSKCRYLGRLLTGFAITQPDYTVDAPVNEWGMVWSAADSGGTGVQRWVSLFNTNYQYQRHLASGSWSSWYPAEHEDSTTDITAGSTPLSSHRIYNVYS